MLADGQAPLELDPAWSPEHLVLAALCRCTLASLDYHAKRASVGVSGEAVASGVVMKRGDDERYAFVEIECGLDVALEPVPDGEALGELIAKAERDCFIGASLTANPRYEWRVNGRVLSP